MHFAENKNKKQNKNIKTMRILIKQLSYFDFHKRHLWREMIAFIKSFTIYKKQYISLKTLSKVDNKGSEET